MRIVWAAGHFVNVTSQGTIPIEADFVGKGEVRNGLHDATGKGVMNMLKPMMRKVALGVPAVALTAALAFTMAGCGGGTEEQKKASDDTATTQPAKEPKAEETPEPAVEAKTGVDYPSYSLEPTDGWKPGTRSMNEKYEECEFTLGDDTFAFIDIRTFKTEPMTEAEARMGSKKDGTIDEVDVNGITWVRHTASNGTVNLFTKAPSGMTVGVVIGSKVDWNDALPMIENIVLK